MKVMKVKDTPEQRAYWEFIERTAAEVNQWPEWMRGGSRAVEDDLDRIGQQEEDE
jgi:hypothetical protein